MIKTIDSAHASYIMRTTDNRFILVIWGLLWAAAGITIYPLFCGIKFTSPLIVIIVCSLSLDMFMMFMVAREMIENEKKRQELFLDRL